MMIHMINTPALLFSVEYDSAWERYSYFDVSRVLGFSTISTVRPDLPEAGLIKGYHCYRRYYTAGFIPYQYLLCSSLQCPTTRSSDVGISHHRNEGNTLTSKRHPVVAIYQVCPVIFSNPVFQTYREVNCLYQKVTMSAIVLEVYCTCCTVV